MQTEYEATFVCIDKEDIRARLEKAGGVQKYPERLMQRAVFNLPGDTSGRYWARVRNEGDRITMSIKEVAGKRIEDFKEAQVTIDSFDAGIAFLRALGCTEKAYQETRRELWVLNNVEVTIDEWPYLEPFVEVEGESEEAVRAASDTLGFNWNTARFCAVGTLYSEKFGIAEDRINNHTPRIVFGESNPFL